MWTDPKTWTAVEARGVAISWARVAGLVALASAVSWAVGAGYITAASLGLFLFGVWTTPKTWTAVLVTVADLNTHIRDNLNILKTSINDDGTLKTLLDKSTTSQSVATNVLTTVYSFSVPGGTLKTGNVLRLVLDGLINATGSSQNFTWVATFGGTSIAGYVQSMTASTVGAFKIEIDIIANGATNLQNIVWRNTLPTIPGVNGVACGGGISTYTIVGVYEGLTKDTTSAQTLAITFQWASTDAADIAKRLAVTLEVLRTT